jgi:hypothetical protein
MPISLNGTNGIVFPDNSLQAAAASPFGLKNRIINGDMRIDQRNNGAAVSGSPSFPVDRFRQSNNGAGVFSGQQISDAPAGFNNSVRFTVTTIDSSIAAGEYYQIEQFIEGFNTADLNWGTANAQTVTLSFWAKASQTGTYSVQLANDAGSRCYPSFYTINVANTWEFKSITIPGSTSGTWLTTNGCGIGLRFGIVYGSTFNGATANAWMNTTGFANSFITSTNNTMSTLNATVQLTGVQLERNTTATPFEWLPYSTELALCQRYYQRRTAGGLNYGTGIAGVFTSTSASTVQTVFPTAMRAQPTASASNIYTRDGINNLTVNSVAGVYGSGGNGNVDGGTIDLGSASTTSAAGRGCIVLFGNAAGYIDFSAEL